MIPCGLFNVLLLLTAIILQKDFISGIQLERGESLHNAVVSILPAVVKTVHGEFFSFDDEPSITNINIANSTTLISHNASTVFTKNEPMRNVTSIPEGQHHETIHHTTFNGSAMSNVSPPSAPFLGYINVKRFLDAQPKTDKIILQTALNNTAAVASAGSNATKLEKRPGLSATNQTISSVNGTNQPVMNAQRSAAQPATLNSVNATRPSAPFLGYINVKKFLDAQPKTDKIILQTTLNNTTVFVNASSNATKVEKRPGPAATITANATIQPITNAQRSATQPIPPNTVNATGQARNMTSRTITANGTIPPAMNSQRSAGQPIMSSNTLNATLPVGNMTLTVRRPTRKRQLRPFALPCDPAGCQLPNCHCGSPRIPGNIPLDETPQMILLTFDDAVTGANFEDYRIIFEKNWTNPNGCPIRGTFYVSDDWTKYGLVKSLYLDGHEMASHSINHIEPPANATRRFWEKQIYGQKENLNKFGGVPLEEVRGMRAPFLQVGGDLQFEMLAEKGFLYDSSIVTSRGNPPLWPYTLDYALPHNCLIEPCPRKSYPGLWEVPMVQWESDMWGVACAMIDTCSRATVPSRVATHDLIMKNFNRHYKTNRAPFGIFMHATWFLQRGRLKGLQDSLHAVMQYDDVWIVTTTQAIRWIQNPTTLTSMETKDFSPWSCTK